MRRKRLPIHLRLPEPVYRFRKTAVQLFLLSCLLTAAQVYLGINPLEHVYSDMRGYVERAWRICRFAPFLPYDTFYPPGASYFYAIFFWILGFPLGIRVLVVVQVLLIASANLLIALTALRLYHSRSAALIVLLLAVLYWPFSAQASFFLAEPLFIFLLVLALYLFADSVESERGHGVFILIGLLLGCAVLVKGQGLASLAGLLGAILLFEGLGYQRRFLASVAAAGMLPIVLQLVLNSAIAGKPALYLGANDVYNTYMGQSRRMAIGALDRSENTFYIFHHNNTGFSDIFLEPMVLPVSLLDREYFREQTRALWRENPARQLTIGLLNMVELVKINPRWPMRNVEVGGRNDVISQWFALVLVVFPALYTLVGAALFKRDRWQAAVLFLPPLGMFALAFITFGQPRYFIPFTYYLVAAAAPFYRDLLRLRAGSGRLWRGA